MCNVDGIAVGLEAYIFVGSAISIELTFPYCSALYDSEFRSKPEQFIKTQL